MAGKTYKTSRGQALDIGSLLLQNENTRAVGNMGVNARGDKIGSGNDIIKTRNEQMDAQYARVHKEANLVKDEPVYKSAAEAKQSHSGVQQVQAPAPEPVVQTAPLPVAETPVAEPVVETPQAPVEKPIASGLAGAIAKAKSVEQSEELTARQQSQNTSGVRKI
tara:strand:+ start:766 stop:1257 length:492 start_codon:yes stop_codon:yes gene_type:complete